MPLIPAGDLARVDEIQEGRNYGQSLSPESGKLVDSILSLVLDYEAVHELKFRLPSNVLAIQIKHLVDKILRSLRLIAQI